MRIRRSVRLENRRLSLMPWLEQESQTQVADGSKLELHQENRGGDEISKADAGVGSPLSIAMRGELQGGGRDSGASLSHVNRDCSEIPPRPPPQVQGPDRAAVGISKAAEVAVPAVDSVKSKQTQPRDDCIDDCNLLTRPMGAMDKSSTQGRINDSHDTDGFSKNLDLVDPAPVPTGSLSCHEDERGSRSKSQMPRAEGRSGRSPSIPWIGLPCPRCKSTNISLSVANAESVVNGMHHQCNNCKQLLCRKNVGSYKVGVRRAKKGASQPSRTVLRLHRTIQETTQAMRNRKPSQQAAPNSNAKAIPPLSNSNMKAIRPPSNPNKELMPPPSYTQKPNVRLPGSQETRSLSCSDNLEDDHPSTESNLEPVVAPEPQARFPMNILEAMGPFPSSANLEESPSNQSVRGNQKEPSFANDGFSVEGVRDSIPGYQSSALEENEKGSGSSVSDAGLPSNDLPCSRCESTNNRFCWPGRYYCNNCREYWTVGHLQHEVQLPSKQFSKGKEKEKQTPYEDADPFSGKGLGPGSLPLQVSEESDGGSNEGPLNALSCSRCKSTFMRLCTYGVFCDACGKYWKVASNRDRQVPANPSVAMAHGVFDYDSRSRDHQMPANPPVAMAHEVLDADSRSRDHQVPANPPVAIAHEVFGADSRSRDHQMQSLPPPQRPIMVVASTPTETSRSRDHQMQSLPPPRRPIMVDALQSLPPPRRPIMVDASTPKETDPVAVVPPPGRPLMVDASTQMDPAAMVPVNRHTDPVGIVLVDSRFGKHTVHGRSHTHNDKVPANPPVAMAHEVFDADSRSRDHQMQSLPPPRRPIMVDASTQAYLVAGVSPPGRPLIVDASTETDPVAMVPVESRTDRVAIIRGDSRFGKHTVHGRSRSHNDEQVGIDERKRRKGEWNHLRRI